MVPIRHWWFTHVGEKGLDDDLLFLEGRRDTYERNREKKTAFCDLGRITL
jgi:hypothetical protein